MQLLQIYWAGDMKEWRRERSNQKVSNYNPPPKFLFANERFSMG